MVLTFEQQRLLIFNGLQADQKQAALGRFSTTRPTNADDNAKISDFFDINTTSATRQLHFHGYAAALLYFENHRFQVLSSPTMGQTNGTIVGHLGDKIENPTAVSISADEATRDILVLAKKKPDGTASLLALMANEKITDTLVQPTTHQAIEFPFPPLDPGQDKDVVFKNYFVTRVPIVVPLPFGHGIDGNVKIDDYTAIADLFAKLEAIHEGLAEWAQGIIMGSDYVDEKSLGELHIPAPFLDGITHVNTVHKTIVTKSNTVDPSSADGLAVKARIEREQKTNTETWLTANPAVYQQGLRQFETPAQIQQAPAQTTPAVLPAAVTTRAEKQSEAKISKAVATWHLLCARASTNADGDAIIIPGEISVAVLSPRILSPFDKDTSATCCRTTPAWSSLRRPANN